MANVDYLEKYKGLSKKDKRKAISKDLASTKGKIKEFQVKEEQLKEWLREDAVTLRVNKDDLETEEVIIHDTKILFKRPTPNNFDRKTASDIEEKFVEVLGEEDGKAKFKQLFEKKVEFKPLKGFADNYFSLPKGLRKRLDRVIPWKGNKAQVNV